VEITGAFRSQLGRTAGLALPVLFMTVAPGRGQDRLCDPGGEDCRSILLNYIRNETVGASRLQQRRDQ
jgi:hypothetical protein